MQSSTSVRQLLQDSQEPVYVATPRELESEILMGSSHIVITDHLDLTAFPLRDTSICPDGCGSPLPEIRRAMSIRVSSMHDACMHAVHHNHAMCHSGSWPLPAYASATREKPCQTVPHIQQRQALCMAGTVHARHRCRLPGSGRCAKPRGSHAL